MPDTNASPDTLSKIRSTCEKLLDESLTYAAFVRDSLEAVVTECPVDAVAIVEFTNPQEPKVAAEYKLASIANDGFFSLDMDHVSLMVESLRQRKTQIAVDRSVPEAGLKPHSIVMAPIITESHPPHILELYTLKAPTDADRSSLQELVETIAAYYLRFLSEHAEKKVSTTDSDFWKRFDAFLLKLQSSLDLKQSIAIATNDGRSLVGADRVSIALKYGNRTRVHGISGQDGVQHRANLVQSMAKVADTIIKIGQPVTYKGTTEGLPPQVEAPLAEYLAESRTRMVMLIPLFEPAPLKVTSDEEPKQSEQRKIVGCLIVEQATDIRPKKSVVERTDLIREHIEVAIHNCHRQESILLLPLWRAMGRSIRWFKGRRLWAAAAILAGVVALGLVLAFVPWDYRVEGEGQAMPAQQHDVFAPWDGDVVEVFVKSGQQVEADQPLLRIESDDLDAERIATKSEQLEKEQLVAALTTQRADAIRKDNADELVRISAELAKAIVEFEGASAKLDKLDKRIEKLTVKAPEAGVVATFQIDQLLRNRPVRRGELLVEIMQPEGPWRLELEVPEYRMGHLMRAITSDESKDLDVEYVLATQVETSYEGTLDLNEIATRSNESEETGTIFEVYVDINMDDLPGQNIGADVTAKINCGKKSLFYVLFGDVVEFLQRHIWL